MDKRSITAVFMVLLASMAIIAISGCTSQQQQTSTPTSQSSTQQTTQQQSTTPSATLKVQNDRGFQEEDDDYSVTGEIVNTGSSTVSRAVLVVTFLDANGNVVETSTEDFENIGPSQIRTFREDADDEVRNIASYKTEIR